MTVFIFIGAPGSGKGTQAERLSEKLSIPEISSGHLLRAHISSGTDIGKQAEFLISQGQLVPDDLVIQMVFERIQEEDCHNGYILDGFPRTIAQAEVLFNYIKNTGFICRVIYLNLPESEIVHRILSRISCSECKSSFSVNVGNIEEEIKLCPKCGAPLIIRQDDNEISVKQRITVYFHNTLPLLEYFKKFCEVEEINALGSREEVFNRIRY
ncbi:MAG: adenylate kinase [Victivallaceae bacterium]